MRKIRWSPSLLFSMRSLLETRPSFKFQSMLTVQIPSFRLKSNYSWSIKSRTYSPSQEIGFQSDENKKRSIGITIGLNLTKYKCLRALHEPNDLIYNLQLPSESVKSFEIVVDFFIRGRKIEYWPKNNN